MSTFAASMSKIFSFNCAISIVAACCVSVAFTSNASANDPLAQVIRGQANELTCAAEDMRDEIKVHFRGTRGYGKLLGTNAQIKARAAAVDRRIKRDPCYRNLERDIAKLNQLACQLSEAYDEAIAKSNAGIGKPIAGETCHVVDKLANMIVVADQMKAASIGWIASQGIAADGFGQETIRVSEFDPNFDIAPGVPPVNNPNRLQPGAAPLPQLELQAPALTPPRPVYRSVLVK